MKIHTGSRANSPYSTTTRQHHTRFTSMPHTFPARSRSRRQNKIIDLIDRTERAIAAKPTHPSVLNPDAHGKSVNTRACVSPGKRTRTSYRPLQASPTPVRSSTWNQAWYGTFSNSFPCIPRIRPSPSIEIIGPEAYHGSTSRSSRLGCAPLPIRRSQEKATMPCRRTE